MATTVEPRLPPTLTSSYLSATSKNGRHWRLRVLVPLAPNVALVENDTTSTALVRNYVVKRVPYASDDELALLLEEAKTWAELSEKSNPSSARVSSDMEQSASYDIVPLIDYFVFDQSRVPAVVFLMAYLPKRQLQSKMSEEKALRFLTKLSATLQGLDQAAHQSHGNITKDSILLDKSGRPKLGGFGMTRAKAQKSLTEDLKALASVVEDSLDSSEQSISPKLQNILHIMRVDNPVLATIRYEIAAARGLLPDIDAKLSSGEKAEKPEGERKKKKKSERKAARLQSDAKEGGVNGDTVSVETESKAVAVEDLPNGISSEPAKDNLMVNGKALSIVTDRAEISANERSNGVPETHASHASENGTSLENDRPKSAPDISEDGVLAREELLENYQHGTPDALVEVINYATDKELKGPWPTHMDWMMGEVAFDSQVLRKIFKILYVRPISKNPVIAFKSLLLIHSLCPKDSKEAFDALQGQDSFLEWIANSWSPAAVQRKKSTKRRPYLSCFAEGDIAMYATVLRDTVENGFNPESIYGLLKVFAGAQDECKTIKYTAIPFLLRDLVDTPFSSDAYSFLRARPEVTRSIPAILMGDMDTTSLKLKPKKGRKKKKKKVGEREGESKAPGETETFQHGTGSNDLQVNGAARTDNAIIGEEVAQGDEISVAVSSEAEKRAQSPEEVAPIDEEQEAPSDAQAASSRKKDTGKSKAGRSKKKVKKERKEGRSKHKKSKRTASKIVNILLAGDLDHSTSEDEVDEMVKEISPKVRELDISGQTDDARQENLQSSETTKGAIANGQDVRKQAELPSANGTENKGDSRNKQRKRVPKVDMGELRDDEHNVSASERSAGKIQSQVQKKKKKKKRDREKKEPENSESDGLKHSDELRKAIAMGRKTPKMNPAFEVMPHEVQLEHQVGSGGFGVVYKGRFRGKIAAIKKIHSHALRNPACIAEFQAEVAVLCTLRHENILEFLGACSKPPNLMIITEYMSNGTLFDLLHRSQSKVTWSMRRNFALDICHGMRYLHGCKLLHRDLKSSNLMLDENFRCKVGDFGLTRISVSSSAAPMTGQCGTFQYMAPEVLGNKPYSEKADVFSFGILLWEMVDRRLPYFGMKPMQVAIAVLNQGLRPRIPPNCPRPLRWLMERCWSQDPIRRPSFVEIAQTLEEMPE